MSNGIKICIDIPFGEKVLITRRDAVPNIITYALKRHGYSPILSEPAQWGYGTIAKAAKSFGTSKGWHLQRIILGSSNPRIAEAIAGITVQDLIEPNAVEGAGLELKNVKIHALPLYDDVDFGSFYCVSPLRVTSRNDDGHEIPIVETGQKFNDAINRVMTVRFRREFKLKVTPDSLYVRQQKGNISARMEIKSFNDGKFAITKGIILPFVLSGPSKDIYDAYCSGLGKNTARGFGCIEVDKGE